MKELYEYKLDLLYYGISITPKCYDALKKGKDGKVNNDDYITTKGLMLLLNNTIYVNANLNDASKYFIDLENEIFVLKYQDKFICNIKVIQPPSFALEEIKLPNGKLITRLVNIHGDRIRLQPIEGCANHCKFCNINRYSYFEYSIEDLDASFRYALENIGFRHILISGGTPLNRNESYEYLNQVYRYFGEKYGADFPIDVMLVPRGLTIEEQDAEGYKKFLTKLKSWHITGIYINLELYNDEIRKKYIPQKDIVGKENYYKFIKLAIEVFGKENVKSCIIVGLESIDDTLKAIEELCKIGCMPVLSPYIPNDDETHAPLPSFMFEVLKGAKKITAKYNIELGPLCASCRHNTIHYK